MNADRMEALQQSAADKVTYGALHELTNAEWALVRAEYRAGVIERVVAARRGGRG